MSVRFRYCLVAWLVIMAMTVMSRHGLAQEQVLTPVPLTPGTPPLPDTANISDDDWVMEIRPARRLNDPVAAPPAAKGTDVPHAEYKTRLDASEYARIYKSIPFNRAEYLFNPAYRHDATMEILTGVPRPPSAVRTQAPVAAPAIAPVSGTRFPLDPASYGYLRPALRLNYYKHFPSLNPYLNFRNLSGAF